jgi:hypothetical protein
MLTGIAIAADFQNFSPARFRELSIIAFELMTLSTRCHADSFVPAYDAQSTTGHVEGGGLRRRF